MTLPLMLTSALPLAQANLMEHVLSHPIYNVGRLYITNHTVMMLIAAVAMFLVFTYVGHRAKDPVPTGLANFFEAMLSFLRTEVFRPALGDNADRFTPFLWNVFFFILFCSLFGLLPIGAVLGLISPSLVHWGGTATGNFSVTAALAICAFIAIHYGGIAQNVRIQMDPSLDPHHTLNDHMPPHGHGLMIGSVGPEAERDVRIDHRVGDGHDHAHGLHHAPAGKPFPAALVAGIGTYIWNYAPHPEMGNAFADVAIWFALLALEMIGTFIKPFALCVRLFANMLAGHLVLGALVGLVPLTLGLSWLVGVSIPVVLGCTAFSALEIFVAFLQAYIFTFLTAIFIASAVAPEH